MRVSWNSILKTMRYCTVKKLMAGTSVKTPDVFGNFTRLRRKFLQLKYVPLKINFKQQRAKQAYLHWYSNCFIEHCAVDNS
jgi:hypothetical protein